MFVYRHNLHAAPIINKNRKEKGNCVFERVGKVENRDRKKVFPGVRNSIDSRDIDITIVTNTAYIPYNNTAILFNTGMTGIYIHHQVPISNVC